MAVERFPVEGGQILVFAAAIGDPNPVYRDPAVGRSQGFSGVIAPPTFVQSSAHFDPEYGLRPAIGAPWFGSGRDATGVDRPGAGEGGGGTGLHAEQHYEYARPLVEGDVLHATVRPGRTWEKEGRRAGTMRFSETVTEYWDQDGKLVVTARAVGVMTSRTVEKEEGQ